MKSTNFLACTKTTTTKALYLFYKIHSFPFTVIMLWQCRILLQCSCLENPMDGGAWWAAVHGVARSRTWLSTFTFTFHFHALEKEMATHSSVLAWRIPGAGEPGGLQSTGSHRVRHDWSYLVVVIVTPCCFSQPPRWPPMNSVLCKPFLQWTDLCNQLDIIKLTEYNFHT